MSQVKRLFLLQETDIAIDECRERMSGIRRELAADPLAAESAALERQKAKLEGKRHELGEEAAAAEDLTERIKHHEQQLYSGRITNPKELAALQKDIELLKGHRAPHEERELELLETMEGLEAAIDEAEIALQRAREKLARRRQELEQTITAEQQRLGELEGRRAGLVADIDPVAVVQYDRLKAQKGRAVARVEQGICRACGIAVTVAWLHRARAGETAGCPSCGRIMYLE
jgi:predicted  nucleic acid-binding Zn-ribbon protein